jgi:hypothetical protein
MHGGRAYHFDMDMGLASHNVSLIIPKPEPYRCTWGVRLKSSQCICLRVLYFDPILLSNTSFLLD